MTMGCRPAVGRAGIPRWRDAVMLTICVGLATISSAQPQPDSLQVRTRALELAYNLDQSESLAVMRRAVADHPNDPASFRTLATIAWLAILFNRGALTVDDYLGPASKPNVNLPEPPPELSALFKDNVERALTSCERRLARNARDVEALYELGATIGLQTVYEASIEGRLFSAFRSARRAFDAHERVLNLAPARKDAGLIVGTYRYIVATLALPLRWMAYLAGFGGGRERGLALIEDAAAFDSAAQVEARFALVLFYNRERRYDDALTVIGSLQERFPRNRLLWLEAGATALRAGRPDNAERALRRGLDMLRTDRRERMFGEDRLWRYKLGAVLVAQGRAVEAERELRTALAAPGRDWTEGRVRTELGKLADARGRRDEAVIEYDRAIDLGRRDNDPIGVKEARRLKREPHRAK